MLASLEVPQTDKEVDRDIIHLLSADYNIEQQIIVRMDLSRVAVRTILRERHLKLNSNAGGNGRALFASGPGRDGPAGERGEHDSGHRQWHSEGNVRG